MVEGTSAIAGSLIVCTRNRADRLAVFLDRLSDIAGIDRWELVLVDNASTDETPRALAEFATETPLSVTLACEPDPGLGRARNAGILAARGAILAFTDDDCYPQEDYLAKIERAFEDPVLGFVGGRVLLYDPEDAPVTIQTSTDPSDILPGSYVVPGLIHGANMAFRRAVIDEVGPFDPELGAGTPFAGEDVDLQMRASAANWRGRYLPEAVVYHHHGRRDPADVDRLMRFYDAGRGAYFMKFLLRRDTRPLFVKRWWWWIDIRQHPGRSLREVKGALHYLLARARARAPGRPNRHSSYSAA
jgi:glycosyltransferase involved in cell wall biosynthesis